ncbi:BLNK protein, partial [Amia calva]|nr:BLNK protein [Amia calva]
QDGAFLVRLSSAQTGRQPYTLVVLYQGKVYNIPVRYLEDSRRYALGKEGKRRSLSLSLSLSLLRFFETLSDIISHHTKNPLLLIDSKSQTKNTTYLAHPARP